MPLSTFLGTIVPEQLRGATWLSLTDVAVLETRTASDDGGGGATDTWVARGTAPCRIYPVSLRAASKLVGGQVNERSTHFCVLPQGTVANTTDRIAIANRGTFEVTLALHRTDSMTIVVEVIQIS